jgi:hypothetical protein
LRAVLHISAWADRVRSTRYLRIEERELEVSDPN